MTTLILTGSKEEIARQFADIDGNVRQVVVFIDEENASSEKVDDFFAEMEPYTVRVSQVDDSRSGIYGRMPGE